MRKPMTRKVRKLATSLALCGALALGGCAGMTAQQGIDAGMTVAHVTQSAAQTYFALNQSRFSPEDAATFQHYLDGFALALETGEGVAPYVQRWHRFLDGE